MFRLGSKCKRDGEWKLLDSQQLVPGDVILLRIGSVVPADVKLVLGDEVMADQSALTGESIPAKKKIGDQIFSGSTIKQVHVVDTFAWSLCYCIAHATKSVPALVSAVIELLLALVFQTITQQC